MYWNNIPKLAQDDLLTWCNTSSPTKHQFRLLTNMYFSGNFHAWDCPTCGRRVYDGDPDDYNDPERNCWYDFPRARQVDRNNLPGRPTVFTKEIIDKQCNHCRRLFNPIVDSTRNPTGL